MCSVIKCSTPEVHFSHLSTPLVAAGRCSRHLHHPRVSVSFVVSVCVFDIQAVMLLSKPPSTHAGVWPIFCTPLISGWCLCECVSHLKLPSSLLPLFYIFLLIRKKNDSRQCSVENQAGILHRDAQTLNSKKEEKHIFYCNWTWHFTVSCHDSWISNCTMGFERTVLTFSLNVMTCVCVIVSQSIRFYLIPEEFCRILRSYLLYLFVTVSPHIPLSPSAAAGSGK